LLKNLRCGQHLLDIETPQVMGILNVTPDSFSDGGKFSRIDLALNQVEQMIADGATIIDIGGESTRPGAKDVTEKDELSRVIPVLKAINKRFNVVVSIDTSKPSVMAEAIAHGAGIINDVRALQNDGCLDVLAQDQSVAICLMHMQGLPRTMQHNPQYKHLITDISTFFEQRILACTQAGISASRLILDPGFGFGKSLEQNYSLLANMDKFHAFNLPLLAGLSRKSMIGTLLNRDVNERLAGSLATAIIAAQQGAKIIRVHDVKETVDALKVLQATHINK
jgi:dihydropteroate synthase